MKQWKLNSGVKYFFGLLLSLSLLLTNSFTVLRATDFDAQEAAARAGKAKIEADLAAMQQRAGSQAADFEQLKAEVAALKEEGKASEGEVAYLQGTFDKAVSELEAAQKEYENSVREMEYQQKLYDDRLVAIFETQNDNNWLSILISSDSLESFHVRYELSRIIADNDKQALDNLETAMEYAKHSNENAKRIQDEADRLLKKAKAQLENLRNNISMQEANLLEKQQQLEQTRDSVAGLQAQSANYDALLKQIGLARQAEAKRQAEERARAAQLAAQRAAARAAAAQNSGAPAAASDAAALANSENVSSVSAGGWVWPNTYSRSITCPFGYGDSVLSNSSFHRGVDLQAAFGSKVVAALGGTVTKAYNPYEGQNLSGGSYGNYIVIDHGNGITTLYGHLKSVQVVEGQQVQAGQLIGLAGSTGNSTGPHLHFEVQVNGSLQNPLNYIA